MSLANHAVLSIHSLTLLTHYGYMETYLPHSFLLPPTYVYLSVHAKSVCQLTN